ncbi:hypothetical protein IT157_07555 [bacterium]|nr:hypothetical protein [bacterium]
MFSIFLKRIFVPLFALAFAVAFLNGCSDDEDNPAGDDSEHAEAFGCLLIMGGDTLVRVDSSSVSGALSVTTGDTLGYIEVWFLDEDGDVFRPEHDHAGPLDEDEHELEIRISDQAIATTELGHEISESLEWAFEIAGVSSGSTTLRVVILHEGHDDYTSALIPLTVAQ